MRRYLDEGKPHSSRNLLFSSDGKVKHILVLRSLPYGLTDAAIAAARKIKFTPATLNSKPVSMILELQYSFAIF